MTVNGGENDTDCSHMIHSVTHAYTCSIYIYVYIHTYIHTHPCLQCNDVSLECNNTFPPWYLKFTWIFHFVIVSESQVQIITTCITSTTYVLGHVCWWLEREKERQFSRMLFGSKYCWILMNIYKYKYTLITYADYMLNICTRF